MEDTVEHLLRLSLLTQKCRLADLLIYNDTANKLWNSIWTTFRVTISSIIII